MNTLDIITFISSVLGVTISVQDIQTWLSVICAVISLISGLTTLIIRIVSYFKIYRSESSEGGKELTANELQDIANKIESGINSLTEKGKKDNGEESNK